jgi:tetratricopeptide (TPR) repeat protein
MESLNKLLEQSKEARSQANWVELERLSIQIMRLIYSEGRIDEGFLRKTLQDYLSSIVGTGEFLTDLQSENTSRYRSGLIQLQEFLKNRPHHFSSIQPTLIAAQEIALLSLNPLSANRNKIAKHLREIARPDLSVIVCGQVLESSRLNYYALTVICGAYCDMGELDKAIAVAEVALRFSPDVGKTFSLNALVRAHTLMFKKTGDFSEIEKALAYGHTSIDIKLDSYSANAFIAAAVASGDEGEVNFAREVLAKAEPELRTADVAALLQAYQAAQALSPKAEVVETIDESDEDGYFNIFESLFDLIVRDEGFVPSVPETRNMKRRFDTEGWFLQGLSKVPCPDCELVALHAYRKHFKRYGKDMHYWALVCDQCKSVTDSIGYQKQTLSAISSDLEQSFPVALLCDECG